MDSDSCMHESDTKSIRLIDRCLMPTLVVFQLHFCILCREQI